MEKNFGCLLSYKVINPSKPLLMCQKMIWHKPVLSVEVTVTFALLTLLDFLFPRIEAIYLTILLPPNP